MISRCRIPLVQDGHTGPSSLFQPIECHMPTHVVTGCTSGQGKPAIFWFQLNFQFPNQFNFLVKMLQTLQNLVH